MMNIGRIIGSLIAFTLSLFLTLSPVGSVVYADEAPPSVTIENLAWAGSGCPVGSVAGGVAPDKRAFTLAFDQYIASTGPGIPITDSRKNCNLLLKLKFPAGWSFTIFTVDYRGFASLDPWLKATQRSAYFFEGDFPSAALRTDFTGPFDDNFEFRDILGLQAVVWSRCSDTRRLNMNTEVRLNNSLCKWKDPKAPCEGLITTDNISGEVKLTYGLLWRRCN